MNQRITVDQFQAAGCLHSYLRIAGGYGSTFQNQHGPQSFSSIENCIVHSLMDHRWMSIFLHQVLQ
jgi:hypothetical protein